MTWSSILPESPAPPVDPRLAASAAALLSALVREEPLVAPGSPAAPRAGVPAQRESLDEAGTEHATDGLPTTAWAALPSDQARRRGRFGRR